MYKPKQKVIWFAVISRLGVILLQFIFNRILPDHDAGVFISPIEWVEEKSAYDNIVDYLFGGFFRWDSHYFLHIAKYGYTYENTLAFSPLYPMTIRYASMIMRGIFYALNERSTMIIAAMLINFLCFIKSAAVFYDLSKIILNDTKLAYKSAILYCINPASIFFSAFYSEAMFACVTFQIMISFAKNNPYVYLPIGLSTILRSNGLINLGFPIYSWIRIFLGYFISKFFNKNFQNHYQHDLIIPYQCKTIVGSLIWLINIIFLSIVPYILLQLYNYILFCLQNEFAMPYSVSKYGLDNNFLIAGTEVPSWCENSIPLAYSHVQKKYWDVGFMNYYTFKQIPNFLLAFPALFIILSQSLKYLNKNRVELYTLGSFQSAVDRTKEKDSSPSSDMFVFVIHGLFLTIFCIFFVHIQVSTRLLCSSSPLLYWYCASSMSYNNKTDDDRRDDKYKHKNENSMHFEYPENLHSKWRVFFLTQKKYSTTDVAILSYFGAYVIIGCVMFSNFLPWT